MGHTIDRSVKLSTIQKTEIERYFSCQPLPCSDNAALFFPLVAMDIELTKEDNIIDGMGNDVFVGHIPARKEFRLQSQRRFFPLPATFERFVRSESVLRKACRSRTELTGLWGLSFYDERRIREGAVPVSQYWDEQDHGEDYLDLRARIRGSVIDQDVFMAKVRGLSHGYGCNVIFPWTDIAVARYVFEFCEEAMFDRDKLRNKVFLRNLLKRRLNVDSDVLGKRVFGFEGWNVVSENRDWALNHIVNCALWRKSELERLLGRLFRSSDNDKLCQSLLYRLFVFSLWVNTSRYIKL